MMQITPLGERTLRDRFWDDTTILRQVNTPAGHNGTLAPGHLEKWRKPRLERPGVRTHLAEEQQSYQGPFTVTRWWGLNSVKRVLVWAESVSTWEKIWRSSDCDAQSNKSGERLIVALPEIWKPGCFVSISCRQTDEWGKETEEGWHLEGIRDPGVKRRLWSAPSCSRPPSTAYWDQWANHGRSLVV